MADFDDILEDLEKIRIRTKLFILELYENKGVGVEDVRSFSKDTFEALKQEFAKSQSEISPEALSKIIAGVMDAGSSMFDSLKQAAEETKQNFEEADANQFQKAREEVRSALFEFINALVNFLSGLTTFMNEEAKTASKVFEQAFGHLRKLGESGEDISMESVASAFEESTERASEAARTLLRGFALAASGALLGLAEILKDPSSSKMSAANQEDSKNEDN